MPRTYAHTSKDLSYIHVASREDTLTLEVGTGYYREIGMIDLPLAEVINLRDALDRHIEKNA